MTSLETLGLLGVLTLVLVLPFSVRHVEEELEAFLLVMGAVAVSVSGQWSRRLVLAMLTDPLALTAAVLVAGAAFRVLRSRVSSWVRSGQERWGAGPLAFVLVLGLGLGSALFTAIVAALVLAEALSALRLPRAVEVRLAILACFAIGLGSGLTPLGGPLAAIAVSRLRGAPYHADFWFLTQSLGLVALAVIAALAIAGAWVAKGPASQAPGLTEDHPESWGDLGKRVLKVYLFVAGLVLLGQGFAPAAEQWLLSLSGGLLYWANMASAVLDNATLAAAEVGPQVPPDKLRALLLGLSLSGGMLIPGNVPNIVCAAKLRIGAKEWARFGVPVGLGLMLIVYGVLFAF